MRVPTGQMVPGPQEPVEQNRVKMGDGEQQQCSGFLGILMRSGWRTWMGDGENRKKCGWLGGGRQGARVLVFRGK